MKKKCSCTKPIVVSPDGKNIYCLLCGTCLAGPNISEQAKIALNVLTLEDVEENYEIHEDERESDYWEAPRYSIYPHKDSYGGWNLYNIWDNEEGEEVPVRGSNGKYTKDRAYAERVCNELNRIHERRA